MTGTAEGVLRAAGVDRSKELARTLAASIGLTSPDQLQRSLHEVRAETHVAWQSFFSVKRSSN